MSKANQRRTLNIFTLKHLALQLKIPIEELKNIAANISKHYHKQETSIYNDDGSLKKVRTTYNCYKRLEKILKSINRNLLKKIILPDTMHGSTDGSSNITNAKVHLGQPYIMNLDITNFFPCITPNHVFNIFNKRLNCSTDVARLLSNLCTTDKHVPQGFNTSSLIANLVLVPATNQMESLCDKIGFRFTVQVDDITVSGYKSPIKLKAKFARILDDCGFNLHPEKSTCRTHKEKQVVTGVVVNRKLNIDKDSFKDLRAKIFFCKKHGPDKFLKMHSVSTKTGEQITNPARLRSHLQGKLNYLRQLNPDKAAPLDTTFKEIQR